MTVHLRHGRSELHGKGPFGCPTRSTVTCIWVMYSFASDEDQSVVPAPLSAFLGRIDLYVVSCGTVDAVDPV